MSTRRGIKTLVLAAFLLGGCGDKVPQSSAAQKIGEQPKQVVDKVTTDVNKALQKGAEARQEAEKKD